ncbi:ion channel [Chelativorans sp. M5D2P16]|uniref:ion channel n=1 Tax=Chelativorans sp. M5D2P16 TaxID=3095678 RepID=UPI002ACA4B9B|nr:ion channel [Chelativorans sp. M5D2P16]MDZ5697626.1 ion channel [Chelativorans sp. M5D2P16]
MIFMTALSIALVLLSVLIHYEALRITSAVLPTQEDHNRSRILVAFIGILCAHLLSILMFAGSYAYLHSIRRFGSLDGKIEGSLVDFVYFSLMSFTTLGVGDIYATGPMRIIAGFQALNGFVLIGWSASFAYVVMQRTET